MKVLFIGLGSISQKHLAAIKRLKPEAEVLALRSAPSSREIAGVRNIHLWKEVPDDIDFALITNPTSEHFKTIKKSLELEVPLFIEKPPFMNTEGVNELIEHLEQKGIRTYTAFNFRFHPVIKWLRRNLVGKRILEVQAYCGSYLPDWRPECDYRRVYSAKLAMGGGVHLDLIHELDYLIWLFKEPEKVNSFRSKVSDLEIDSMDTAHYWLQYNNFNVSVLLNYYRRDAKRSLEIVMADDTWEADLLNGKVTSSGKEILFSANLPISETYNMQMKYFLDGLNDNKPYMNNLRESVKTLEYCLK